MKLVNVVLFLHIAVALSAFGIALIIHQAEWSGRRATTVGELRTWAGVIRRFGPMFPIVIVLLLGLGSWLLHLSGGQFRWSHGWVIGAVVSLAVLLGIGGGVLDPAAKALVARLADAPEGPVTADLRTAACDPVSWTLGHLSTGLALGVVFLMTTKPTGAGSTAILVAGSLLGGLIGYLGARTGAPTPA